MYRPCSSVDPGLSDGGRMLLRPLILVLLVAGCQEPLRVATSADPLVAAAHALAEDARTVGACAALKQRLRSDALAFSPVPRTDWVCEDAAALGALHRVELAASGDFGYTIYAALVRDSSRWQVLVWRLEPDSTWRVEAVMRTLHPPPALRAELTTRAGAGWVRARRKLYQEAARVAMLKADRDLAAASVDASPMSAFANALADSVLQLREAHVPVQGRRAALDAYQSYRGMMTWVPIAGAIAAGGDLGYTYGLETVRPLAPDTVLHSSTYLRLWRAMPDSTWRIVVNAHTRISMADTVRSGLVEVPPGGDQSVE